MQAGNNLKINIVLTKFLKIKHCYVLFQPVVLDIIMVGKLSFLQTFTTSTIYFRAKGPTTRNKE